MQHLKLLSTMALVLMALLPKHAQALPFVPTTDPTLSTTHWYQLKNGSVYVIASSGYFLDCEATTTSGTTDYYLWCFVGDESSGYTIYNRARKAYMASGPSMNTSSTVSTINRYEAIQGSNNFYIYYKDTGQKFYLAYDSDNGLYSSGYTSDYCKFYVNEVAVDPGVVTPYSTLTAQSYYIPTNALSNLGVEGYAKLFDKDKNTKWCVVNTSGAWQKMWVDFKSDVPFIPKSYVFTTGNDTKRYPNRNPKAWAIYGRINESDQWTKLVDVTDGAALGLGTENTTDYSFDLSGNTGLYQYFRFEVSEICGINTSDNNYTFQLAELQFTGEQGTVTVPGDLSGDGIVDVSDLNLLINVLLGMETNARSDINGDNITDVGDLNALINIMLGKETAADGQLTLCDSTKTSQHVPINGTLVGAEGNMGQMLYSASMLTSMKGKTITSVKFYPQTAIPQWGCDLEMRLKETDRNDFSEPSWEQDGTLVDTMTGVGGGTSFEFVLDQPFIYHGDKNLVVEVRVSKAGNPSPLNYYGTSTSEGYSAIIFGGAKNYTYFLPKVTFTYE